MKMMLSQSQTKSLLRNNKSNLKLMKKKLANKKSSKKVMEKIQHKISVLKKERKRNKLQISCELSRLKMIMGQNLRKMLLQLRARQIKFHSNNNLRVNKESMMVMMVSKREQKISSKRRLMILSKRRLTMMYRDRIMIMMMQRCRRKIIMNRNKKTKLMMKHLNRTKMMRQRNKLTNKSRMMRTIAMITKEYQLRKMTSQQNPRRK